MISLWYSIISGYLYSILLWSAGLTTYKAASVAHIRSDINKGTNFQSIEHVVEACMTTPVLTTIVLGFLLSFFLPITVCKHFLFFPSLLMCCFAPLYPMNFPITYWLCYMYEHHFLIDYATSMCTSSLLTVLQVCAHHLYWLCSKYVHIIFIEWATSMCTSSLLNELQVCAHHLYWLCYKYVHTIFIEWATSMCTSSWLTVLQVCAHHLYWLCYKYVHIIFIDCATSMCTSSLLTVLQVCAHHLYWLCYKYVHTIFIDCTTSMCTSSLLTVLQVCAHHLYWLSYKYVHTIFIDCAASMCKPSLLNELQVCVYLWVCNNFQTQVMFQKTSLSPSVMQLPELKCAVTCDKNIGCW